MYARIAPAPAFASKPLPLQIAWNAGCRALALLRRAWVAACRHAERPERCVPYC